MVYYKDDTHYFVCTAMKESLIKKGVLRADVPDVVGPANVNRERLEAWCQEVASFAGLPKSAPMEVMRDGMATDRLDPAGIYFGTNAGEVWASADEGKSWDRVAAYLPSVLSMSTATLG